MADSCPTLVCMGWARTYVENVTYVTYILEMVAIINYNFMLSEDIAHA